MLKRYRWLSLALVALVIALMGLYLYYNPNLLATLNNISLGSLAVLLFLRFALMMTTGYKLKIILEKFNIHLNLEEWIGLPVVTTLGNYITPFSGGMVARATYLKHKHTLPYAQFISILTATYAVNYWVVGLVGLISWLSLSALPQSSWVVAAIFLGATVGISGLVWLPRIKISLSGRLGSILETALAGWYLIRDDKKLLLRLVGNILLTLLWHSLSYWVAYNALGAVVSYQVALMVSLMTMFSLMLSITPGNFGVLEAIASLTAELLGSSAGETLIVSLLIRAVNMVLAFTLGPVFTWRLSHLALDSSLPAE